jgi:hypothetical protein
MIMEEELMNAVRYVIIKLEDPVIRTTAIGVASMSFAGIYMWVKGIKKNTYDTITDLKKKAKAFNKANYNPTKNKGGL